MEHRKKVEAKAQEQVSQLRVAAPCLMANPFVDRWPDEEMDTLVQRFDALPCPALESDGRCGVYEYRPLVCRSMGLPMDSDGVVSGACIIQTSVPLIRLSNALREEENLLAGREAEELAAVCHQNGAQGGEVLLPYAFLAD